MTGPEQLSVTSITSRGWVMPTAGSVDCHEPYAGYEVLLSDGTQRRVDITTAGTIAGDTDMRLVFVQAADDVIRQLVADGDFEQYTLLSLSRAEVEKYRDGLDLRKCENGHEFYAMPLVDAEAGKMVAGTPACPACGSLKQAYRPHR